MFAALARVLDRVLGTPRRAFTVLAAVFGLAWVFANPAWLGFDERTHFARAWGLSGGHILAEEGLAAPDGSSVAGDRVPIEFTTDRDMYIRAVQRTGLDDLYAGYGELLRSRPGSDDDYVDTRPALAAPVTGYLPSAVPLVLVRLFDIPLLAGLWLARAANLAVFVLVVRYALSRTRALGWPIAVASLVPVNLYVAASVSPDAVIIAGVALSVALATRLVDLGAGVAGLSRRDIVLAIAVLASLKPPYSVVGAVLPAVALAADPRAWRQVARSPAMLVLATTTLSVIAWRLFAAPAYEPVAVFFEGDPFDSDPSHQLELAGEQPLRLAGSVLHSTFLDLPLYMRRWMFGFGPFELASSLVGSFFALVMLGAGVVAWNPGSSAPWMRGRARVAVAAVAVAAWLALVAANYLYFIAGVPRSLEIPGRYSAPLLALVLAAGLGHWSRWLAARVRVPAGAAQTVLVAVLLVSTGRAFGVWKF